MGICASESADAKASRLADRAIAKELENSNQRNAEIIKLLLLGAGESGKSTIFKQMRILYGDGYDENSRKATAPVIISNLIGGSHTILENCEITGHPLQDPAAQEAAKAILAMTNLSRFDDEVHKNISILWNDPDYLATYDDRSKFQLFDTYADFAKYACRRGTKEGEGRWGDVDGDWIPSVADTLKARVRTSGIVEENYKIDGVAFQMYDVGGQRNERKKWIHCFDKVTAIIFVGAISEYDQVLYEDKTQNRLLEAIELFEEICNSKWFINTSMILFLNKRDLFEIKYLEKKIPLNITGLFPTAPEINPNDNEAQMRDSAETWFVSKFLQQNKNEAKEIYHHITCATDTGNVATVFNACKDVILKNNLRGSGFLD